jgi:hypothetical protein
MPDTLPQRREVPDEKKWNVESVFPSANAWEEEFVRVGGLFGSFAEYAGQLGTSAATLTKALARIFAAPILTSVIAAVALTGCAHRATASVGQEFVPPSETHQSFTKAWLQIREEHHCIIAAGDYRLPEAIVIPPALAPIPLALVSVSKSSKKIISIQVYFPSAQEQAVYKWAQSYPDIVSSSSRVVA